MNLESKIEEFNKSLRKVEELRNNLTFQEGLLNNSMELMKSILEEQELLQKCTLIIQQCRPLLSKSAIEHCLKLANTAIKTIFSFDAILEYDVELNSFIMNYGDYKTELVESEGGGLLAVISFVFTVYLILKLEKRRLMVFDEHFTQISSEYLPQFLMFVKQLAKDLKIDIVIVSHDSRITPDMVDVNYYIEGGRAFKV